MMVDDKNVLAGRVSGLSQEAHVAADWLRCQLVSPRLCEIRAVDVLIFFGAR